MLNYIAYHCHSDYSLIDSCTKFEEYADLAKQYGQKAIASTEHGKPQGWVSKKMYCDSIGIKFIHGVEMYLTETLEEKVRDNYHTVLLAKNLDGVLELNKLISLSCEDNHQYYVNRITFDEFLNISDNIISTSACLGSPLWKLPKEHPRYMELVNKYTFLEIQPHNHPEQIEFNQRLYDLSKTTGVPLIAGTDTHSSTQYKAECRNVLISAKRKPYGDEDAFDLTYKSYDELTDMFAEQNSLPRDVFEEAISNTNLLDTMIENFELDTEIKYPILYETRENDSKHFEDFINSQFELKLQSGVIPREQEEAFRKAIKEELRVFQKLKMDGFMLSMGELITWCKEQGMAIGTARGSVGGSRIAYIINIIDLNPETWGTVFSRFCNEDRVEIGDIDIDCVDEDRPAIFKYITERFGSDKTARVSSFGTIQGKGVIDEIGRHLAKKWDPTLTKKNNPWGLSDVARIKKEFEADEQKTRNKYPEMFYYYDGMMDTKVSQSVHPAGMVISPITLNDNYGMFNKDGENCLMLDMEEAHEVGVAKYDFLVLKTVQVIRDTCTHIGVEYPKTHEIDWLDKEVWEDIISSPSGVFQFEGSFAFNCLKDFKPQSIFDMSLVTASIRPSGASYRGELLARKPHKNPSELIDNLLSDNLGYLIYQEDTIKFLQEICGLSGSDADNIRRAIGRKQKDRLDKALPSILEGYCNVSPQPREVAEQEAKEFLQIIEDSASYQFNYSHSVAYCLLGYLCAYYRHYYPLEFLTAELNIFDGDMTKTAEIINYANQIGVRITPPKWGVSKSNYLFNNERKIIAKGLGSIKYMGTVVADELYELSQNKSYKYFVDLLSDINKETNIDSRQLDILIKLDFFSDFGNQRELLTINEMFTDKFKKGELSKIKRGIVDGTEIESIVQKYSVGVLKSGGIAKSYTLLDVRSILVEIEDLIFKVGMKDLDDLIKIQNFYDAMGYIGYVSGKEEDRRKLYILDIKPVCRKSDGKQFGYGIFTKSLGSGKESRLTVFNRVFDKNPIEKNSIIYCKQYERNGQYFTLTSYDRLF